jgi:hypothetical protein
MDSKGNIIDAWTPLFFITFIIIVGQFSLDRNQSMHDRYPSLATFKRGSPLISD